MYVDGPNTSEAQQVIRSGANLLFPAVGDLAQRDWLITIHCVKRAVRYPLPLNV